MKKHTLATTKLIVVIAIMIAMFTAFSVVAFADGESATVSCGSKSVSRGKEVTFSVSVNANSVRSIAIVPTYDTDLFDFVSGTWNPEVADKAILSNFSSSPVPNALLATESAVALNGEVLTFTLSAKDDAAITSSAVTVKFMLNGNNEVTNVTGVDVKVCCAPTAHTWVKATCTTPKTCTECGETSGEIPGHIYGYGVVTKYPTETADGEKVYTCVDCSDKKTEIIPKISKDAPIDSLPEERDNTVVIIIGVIVIVAIIAAVVIVVLKKFFINPDKDKTAKEEDEDASKDESSEKTDSEPAPEVQEEAEAVEPEVPTEEAEEAVEETTPEVQEEAKAVEPEAATEEAEEAVEETTPEVQEEAEAAESEAATEEAEEAVEEAIPEVQEEAEAVEPEAATEETEEVPAESVSEDVSEDAKSE